MQRLAAFLYGLIAYSFFFAVFLYLIGFLTGFIVPRAINDGPVVAWPLAVAVDVGLVLLFGVQHTIMARPGFKSWITGLGLPRAVERSTFVLATCVVLGLTFVAWRPIPTVIWNAESDAMRVAISALAGAGWGMVLLSTFLINHFDLFGLRQVFLNLRRVEYFEVPYVERMLYRLVRHPLMLGFLIAFWATPTMTVGHLVFAIAMTSYILVGIRFEERDLVRQHGERYLAYRSRTNALVPWPRRVDVAAPKPQGPAMELSPATTLILQSRD